MNQNLIKLALDTHLINYVDNETPCRYFINGNADVEEIENFANELIGEVLKVLHTHGQIKSILTSVDIISDTFGE